MVVNVCIPPAQLRRVLYYGNELYAIYLCIMYIYLILIAPYTYYVYVSSQYFPQGQVLVKEQTTKAEQQELAKRSSQCTFGAMYL